MTLIFSLDRYKAVVEAYIRGLERLVEAGGDPSPVASVASFFVSRVDTEADKRLEALGNIELAGEARDREREAGLPALPRGVPGRALGASGRGGRDEAALPLGLDLDEEPCLPRRHVRGGADRPADGEHDAARDDRGLPGSRRGSRRHAARRDRRGEAGLRRPARGGSRLRRRRPRRSSARGCRSSRTRSRSCSPGSARSGPSSPRRELGVRRSSSGSGRTTRRSGPTPGRTAGSAGSMSSRACGRGSTRSTRSLGRPSSSSTHSFCSAWAARASRRRCSGARFGGDAVPRPRHHAPGSDQAPRGRARPRAHALHRLLEVGLDARDALARGLLLGALRRPRRAVRGDHRSRLGARAHRHRARLSRRSSPASPRSAAATRRCRSSASCRRR